MQARLGLDMRVLDPTPNCPASIVASQTVGSFQDADALLCVSLTMGFGLGDLRAMTKTDGIIQSLSHVVRLPLFRVFGMDSKVS